MKQLLFSFVLSITVVAIICPATICASNHLKNNTTPGQREIPPQSLRGNGMGFTPNKGQIIDISGNLRPDILYKGYGGGAGIYLRKTGISYVFNNAGELKREEEAGLPGLKNEAPKAQMLKLQRVDVDFVNCNANTKMLTVDKMEGYTNYYYAHCPQGITNVNSYNQVTAKNIYNYIDIKYYGGKAKGLKYDIVVNPGGDPDDIKLQYSGVEKIKLENEKLIITTSLGGVGEYMPKVYQNINGEIINVKAAYALNSCGESNTSQTFYRVGFRLGKYNKNYSLIIDPWATYCGGTGEDSGVDVATDNSGNVVITGNTKSVNFPVLGASQVSNAGLSDVFVVKFNSAGVRQWATYYGGNMDDNGSAITTDNADNVLITGITTSSVFPVFSGNQMVYGGGASDVFVVKFNNNGLLQWSSYYGGSSGEGGSDIATDNAGYVVITGRTASTDFPVSGVSQIYGGGGDAFIVKFDTNGLLQWSTYYGGSKGDDGSGIDTDAAGNVVIVGNTLSLDLPVPNGYQIIFGGGKGEACAAYFSPAGILQWGTYYGGSAADGGYGIVADNAGNIIIAGGTTSLDLPVFSGYQMVYGGGSDGFLVKFNPDGTCQWATYYGGTTPDFFLDVAVDGNNNIYLTSEMEDRLIGSLADACAYQTLPGDTLYGYGYPEDMLIIKYTTSGQKICTTYLGGLGEDDIDLGGGIAIYGTSLYVTESTIGIYPVTAGAFQTLYAGPNHFPAPGGYEPFGGAGEAILNQICTNICEGKTLDLNYTANVTNVCINAPVTFTPSVNNSCDTTGYRFQWIFTGGIPASSSSANATVVYNVPGTYPVKLLLTTICKTDSITNYIIVSSCVLPAITKTDLLCNGNGTGSATVTPNGTPPYIYLWSRSYNPNNYRACSGYL